MNAPLIRMSFSVTIHSDHVALTENVNRFKVGRALGSRRYGSWRGAAGGGGALEMEPALRGISMAGRAGSVAAPTRPPPPTKTTPKQPPPGPRCPTSC
jgi:hypothetical protein